MAEEDAHPLDFSECGTLKAKENENETLKETRKRNKRKMMTLFIGGHILNDMKVSIFDFHQVHEYTKFLWNSLED